MCNRKDCRCNGVLLKKAELNRKKKRINLREQKYGQSFLTKALIVLIDLLPRPDWSTIFFYEKLIAYTWFLLNSLWGICTWLFFWSGLLVPWTFLTITPFGHGLFFVLNLVMGVVSSLPLLYKSILEMLHNYKEYLDEENNYYY